MKASKMSAKIWGKFWGKTWVLVSALAASGCIQENASIGPDFGVSEEEKAKSDPGNQGAAGGVQAFRRPLQEGDIPNRESLNDSEFLAQHRFALRAPECELDLCLQSSIARKNTLVANEPSTMLTLGLNSAVDPSSLASAPRHIALAIDTSKAMTGAALQELQRALTSLSKALKDQDRVTLVAMSTQAEYLALAEPKEKLIPEKKLSAVGDLNLYDGLRKGFDALQAKRRPNERRILIAALADNASAGIVDHQRLRKLSSAYAELGNDVHAIAIGQKVDQQELRTMARNAGGHFHFIDSARELGALLTSPQALSNVTLARDIDIRVELGDNYSFRGSYGAKVHAKGPTHVTVRVPTFDLVAQPGASGESSLAQKVFVLELDQRNPTSGARIGELSFSYLKGTSSGAEDSEEDKRVQSKKRLISGPSSASGDYFEDEAARRAFGLINLYAVFERALLLLEKDSRAQALLLMDKLEAGLEGWLSSSAPESAITQERGYLELMRNIVRPQVNKPLAPDAPVVDPIIAGSASR